MITPKYTLQIDRLTVSLSLNTENAFNFQYVQKNYLLTGNSYSLLKGIELRKTIKKLDKYYTNSFEVWIENSRIGTLHTDSRLPQTDKVVKFELSNYVFYSKPSFTHYLSKLQQVGLYVKSISYCEIVLDTQLLKPLLPRLSRYERYSTLDSANPNPKYRPLRAKTVCHKLHNGKEYIFGDTGNGRAIAVYNKSREIEENSEKEYITQFHQAHGLNTSQPVERIEARIGNKWLVANNLAIDENDLANPGTLCTLFIKAVGDSFKYTDINNPKAKRNAQGNYNLAYTDLLPLSFIQAKPVKLTERWKVGNEIEMSDSRKRTTYRALIDAYISQGTAEALASLNYFQASQKPPKKTTWQHLTSSYAMKFDGIPTADSKARIVTLIA